MSSNIPSVAGLIETLNTTINIEINGQNDVVIEAKTYQSRKWQELKTKFKVSTEIGYSDATGHVYFDTDMSLNDKKAYAGLVTKISQKGNFSIDDEEVIKKFLLAPVNNIIVSEIKSHLNSINPMGNEKEESVKQSSGASSKRGQTAEKTEN